MSTGSPDEASWSPTGTGQPQGPGQGAVLPDGDLPEAASQATPSRPGTNIVRPMPRQSDGPSFEAIAMQSVLSRAKETSRFVPPPPAEGPRRRAGFPLRALITVLAVTIMLGAALGVVYVQFFRSPGIGSDDVIVQPTATTSEQAGHATPQEVVVGYLQALADGDITEALRHGQRVGAGSAALLTPEAYANMPTTSRPSNIEILTSDPGATEIAVRYTLDGEVVERSYRTVRQADDTYLLDKDSITATWQIPGGSNLPLFVNGVEVDHTQPLQLVPGTYELSTGLDFIAFPSSSRVTIQSLSYDTDPVFPLNPELTEAGRSAFQAQARESLAGCLAMRSLDPDGCPNSVKVSQSVDPSSISWQLHNDPWRNFAATLDGADQSQATASVELSMSVTMNYSSGLSAGTTPVNTTVRLSANMLGGNPDNIHITWGS